MSDLLFKVGLTLIPKIGDVMIKQLISYCGSPEQIFKEKKGALLKIPRIGTTLADSISSSKVLTEAEAIIKQAETHKTELLFYTDKAYPNRLKTIDDSPCLIYYKGNANLNSDKIVAIVGTRNATDYGIETTQQIVSQLTEHRALIVSGLAYGIDITAHRSALKHGLPTVGVMANGLDTVYPSRHAATAKAMTEFGGLISENVFGSKPDAPKFPARNRIIAGMCDAIIVVEAAAKGGALITAEIAHGYNKELFAVPGNINRPYSQGCNKLIKEHKAIFLSSVQDLEKELNWDLKAQENLKKLENIIEHLNGQEKAIVELLVQNESMLVDELGRKTQTEIYKLSGALLNLELQGIVKVLPGKKYTLSL